jgi:hypothetical protein
MTAITTTTERVKDVARRAWPSVRQAAVDVSDSVRDAARRAPGRVKALGQTVRELPRALPPETLPELARSVRNLRKVRTPRQAVAVFETETERLLTVVTPMLVRHPLPVRSTATAKAIVATAGGLAAAGEEIEELAALVSSGVTVPPTLPIMLTANLLALVVEVYVAASLRVHDVVAAGVEPDPHDVARDVIIAMTGRAQGESGVRRYVTKQMVKSIVARVLSRWGASLVPFVGIAYSGWDAQRTVEAIRAIPLPDARALETTSPLTATS